MKGLRTLFELSDELCMNFLSGAAAEFFAVQHLVQPGAGEAARPQGRRRAERARGALHGEDQAVPGLALRFELNHC